MAVPAQPGLHTSHGASAPCRRAYGAEVLGTLERSPGPQGSRTGSKVAREARTPQEALPTAGGPALLPSRRLGGLWDFRPLRYPLSLFLQVQPPPQF